MVKLFASTDRVTRARLLTTLVHFIGHLQPQVVNDQIFPNVAMGFLDTNPYIRDQTIEVRTLTVLVGKLLLFLCCICSP